MNMEEEAIYQEISINGETGSAGRKALSCNKLCVTIRCGRRRKYNEENWLHLYALYTTCFSRT
jgi:hypothetical protein